MNVALPGKVALLSVVAFLVSCNDFGATSQTLPAHLEVARTRAMQLCSGCHGPTGISGAPYNPNLACQKKEYMVKQLNYYRDGSRTTHQPMNNIARLLSEAEVEDISEWYSITGCP